MRIFLAVVFVAFLFAGCGEDGVSVGSKTSALTNEVHPWSHGDWSWRILYEARHAVKKWGGECLSNPSNPGLYDKCFGSWNYVASDWNAYFRSWEEADGVAGNIGYYNGYNHGGECTFFVRLVLYRSTAWAFNDHYTMPGHPYLTVYTIRENMTPYPNQWQPGWVVRSNGHFAIAEKRATVQGYSGWWIIDSNWVLNYAPYYEKYVIGKHFMTDNQLSSQGYYGWNPDLATYN